jgi:hypothetical protein
VLFAPLQDLADIDALSELKSLEMLSLVNNPVQKKPHYRHLLIYRLPKLRILDFRKVSHQVCHNTRFPIIASVVSTHLRHLAEKPLAPKRVMIIF